MKSKKNPRPDPAAIDRIRRHVYKHDFELCYFYFRILLLVSFFQQRSCYASFAYPSANAGKVCHMLKTNLASM